MAVIPKIYVDDVGTLVALDTKLTPTLLMTATTHEIRVLRPDGALVSWVGTVQGSNVEYITKLGDLPQSGSYKMQVYLVLPSWRGRGDTVTMKVSDPFK